MVLDIFSTFDPGINYMNNTSPIMFWMVVLTSISLFSLSMWSTPSTMLIISGAAMSVMNNQSNRTKGLHIKGFNSLIVALFMILISINLIGLLPTVFSYSSHLLFTLSFGLPLWLSLIMSAILFDQYKWAANLLPGGAPHWLNPFLVLIETISISVRPITLSFRLAANMSAGHIVLTLISTYTSNALFSSVTSLMILTLIQLSYVMFEFGICLIQSYIFCLLLSLYADDHT